MHRVPHHFKSALLIPAAVCMILMVLPSCSKVCQRGYANPNCSIEIRVPFENLYYTATESMNGDSAYTYPATIIPDPANILQVELTNVANNFFTHNVTGRVSNATLTYLYSVSQQGKVIMSSKISVVHQ